MSRRGFRTKHMNTCYHAVRLLCVFHSLGSSQMYKSCLTKISSFALLEGRSNEQELFSKHLIFCLWQVHDLFEFQKHWKAKCACRAMFAVVAKPTNIAWQAKFERFVKQFLYVWRPNFLANIWKFAFQDPVQCFDVCRFGHHTNTNMCLTNVFCLWVHRGFQYKSKAFMNHVIPRCTEHLWCTQDIPSMYSWYLPDVVSNPRFTDNTLYRVDQSEWHRVCQKIQM